MDQWDQEWTQVDLAWLCLHQAQAHSKEWDNRGRPEQEHRKDKLQQHLPLLQFLSQIRGNNTGLPITLRTPLRLLAPHILRWHSKAAFGGQTPTNPVEHHQ